MMKADRIAEINFIHDAWGTVGRLAQGKNFWGRTGAEIENQKAHKDRRSENVREVIEGTRGKDGGGERGADVGTVCGGATMH